MDLGAAIDRGLGVLAPRMAARRMRARAELDGLERARDMLRVYDAAGAGRRNATWTSHTRGVNAELRTGLSVLRARSRDLTQNNAWAGAAVRAWQTSLVGSGFGYRITVPSAELDAEGKPRNDERAANYARTRFERWAEKKVCDLRGRQTLHQMLSTGAREFVEAGEFLARKVLVEPSPNDPLPLRIQFLEPDYIDTSRDSWVSKDGAVTIQGVTHNRFGARTSYWLHREHPGEVYAPQGVDSFQVPADDILHPFEVLRYGQVRGVPQPTAALVRARDLDELHDAQLVRQKVAACFVGFVHDQAGADEEAARFLIGQKDTASDDPKARKFSPGTWQHLPPGKDITFGSPPPALGLEDTTRVTLWAVAKGYEIPYERLTGDLSRVNFSSGRMGAVPYHEALDRVTWLNLVPDVLDRIWEWFVEISVALDPDFPPAARCEWTAPRRALVDPSREIPAKIQAIRAGLASRSESLREGGYDPSEVDAEIAEENQRAERLGLSFSSDGRRAEQSGEPDARSRREIEREDERDDELDGDG